MAGFILVFFFGLMSYLLSQIHKILVSVHEVLEVCLDFDDLSEAPDITRVSNIEEGGV